MKVQPNVNAPEVFSVMELFPHLPPQVTYKAPEPMGEHFIAESFDRGTLDG